MPKGVWVPQGIAGGELCVSTPAKRHKLKTVQVMPKKLQLPSIGINTDASSVFLLKENQTLKEEIKRLKLRKKYGLIWEEKPEAVVELCKKKLPVIIESD